MGPNEMLRRFREHYAEYREAARELSRLDGDANQSKIGDVRDEMTSALECAADYAHDLDEWLSQRDGYLPDAWANKG